MRPVNLNQVRKARAKAKRDAQAAQNRVKFGRTKAEKRRDDLTGKRAAKAIDLHRREP